MRPGDLRLDTQDHAWPSPHIAHLTPRPSNRRSLPMVEPDRVSDIDRVDCCIAQAGVVKHDLRGAPGIADRPSWADRGFGRGQRLHHCIELTYHLRASSSDDGPASEVRVVTLNAAPTVE